MFINHSVMRCLFAKKAIGPMLNTYSNGAKTSHTIHVTHGLRDGSGASSFSSRSLGAPPIHPSFSNGVTGSMNTQHSAPRKYTAANIQKFTFQLLFVHAST